MATTTHLAEHRHKAQNNITQAIKLNQKMIAGIQNQTQTHIHGSTQDFV